MKTLPLDQLMKFIYPEFYNIDLLFYHVQNSPTNIKSSKTNTKTMANVSFEDDDEDENDLLPDIPRLQLTAEL